MKARDGEKNQSDLKITESSRHEIDQNRSEFETDSRFRQQQKHLAAAVNKTAKMKVLLAIPTIVDVSSPASFDCAAHIRLPSSYSKTLLLLICLGAGSF